MEILIDYLSKNNIEFSIEDIDKFQRYYDLLIEYNQKFNLTAITDNEEVQIKHFIDSLSALPYIENGATVVDIGTGAGFPSIPLAILQKNSQFTLVDSLLKRVGFLNTVIQDLNLTNATAIHSRAEDLSKTTRYDVAVARAVAPLNILLEYIAPFIKIKGKALIYKASGYKDELELSTNAIKTLGLELRNTYSTTLFNTDIQRVLLEFIKIKSTPDIYPRGQNKPRKFPL